MESGCWYVGECATSVHQHPVVGHVISTSWNRAEGLEGSCVGTSKRGARYLFWSGCPEWRLPITSLKGSDVKVAGG